MLTHEEEVRELQESQREERERAEMFAEDIESQLYDADQNLILYLNHTQNSNRLLQPLLPRSHLMMHGVNLALMKMEVIMTQC